MIYLLWLPRLHNFVPKSKKDVVMFTENLNVTNLANSYGWIWPLITSIFESNTYSLISKLKIPNVDL